MPRSRPTLGTVSAALIAGVAADRIFGDPARLHPVAGFGSAVLWAERRWHQPTRPRGILFTATAVAAPTLVVGFTTRALRRQPLAQAAVGAAAIWATLGGRSLERAGDELAALLEAGDLKGARALLPSLAGRDPSNLDLTELARAGTESIAENTSDAVVGALLWGALLGPAGAVAFRAANTLDAMHGHRSPRYEQFGWAAARLDDALGFLPARLGAWSAAANARAVGGTMATALRILRRDGRAHPSPNAGPMEAAFAGALGVQLGGPLHYGPRLEERPRQGDGRAPDAAGLRGAVQLSRAVTAASLATALALRASLALWRRRPSTLTT